jgi:putative oxidoreductase
MNSPHSWHEKLPEQLDGIGLLALRIWAGQEFLTAGWTKLSGGLTAPDWFSALDFPPPLHWLTADLNWLAAGMGEMALGLALIIGLFSRLSAIGLLFITYVAVYTVHFDLGLGGWNQIETEQGLGFKVPAMLAIMLLAIVTQGGGPHALDALVSKLRRRAAQPLDPQHT